MKNPIRVITAMTNRMMVVIPFRAVQIATRSLLET
ncbi:hypothetical protein BMETH_1151_0 [methanotrophic bacterial endosymbiont of Bathymodiolus sp.]|nr:hypothetical protein BMETH_1151_0 [methanotrophic bacterial endosymbiont of Bathymodiolus sp.]